MKTVAVIGASADRRKYGNRAVRAFARRGYHVIPITPLARDVEGIPAFPSVSDVPGPIDMATFYVPPSVGLSIIDEVARKGVREVWFNPGSESPDLLERARVLGLSTTLGCSIIAIGEVPV